jgi:hypothetical protein
MSKWNKQSTSRKVSRDMNSMLVRGGQVSRRCEQEEDQQGNKQSTSRKVSRKVNIRLVSRGQVSRRCTQEKDEQVE